MNDFTERLVSQREASDSLIRLSILSANAQRQRRRTLVRSPGNIRNECKVTLWRGWLLCLMQHAIRSRLLEGNRCARLLYLPPSPPPAKKKKKKICHIYEAKGRAADWGDLSLRAIREKKTVTAASAQSLDGNDKRLKAPLLS